MQTPILILTIILGITLKISNIITKTISTKKEQSIVF